MALREETRERPPATAAVPADAAAHEAPPPPMGLRLQDPIRFLNTAASCFDHNKGKKTKNYGPLADAFDEVFFVCLYRCHIAVLYYSVTCCTVL